jgi:hypothetical protein
MTSIFLSLLRRPIAALALCSFVGAALASPGAHGPNGEHLDTMQAGSAAASTAPRLEAKSELFELVGRLSGGEFSILIDRFATNEPLLKADVEVESGQLKAKARFHEDLGDYAVDDPAMLKLLSTPGEHPVVITIMAGEESDLLDGVLKVEASVMQPEAHHHGHAAHDDEDHALGHIGWGWAALIALVFGAAWIWRKRSAQRSKA